jgi:hypothetical protein
MSLLKHNTATSIRRNYILGCVLTPVRDRSGTQPLVSPGEIDVLDHNPERPGQT